MAVTSDSICVPSTGFVKIPEGSFEWQCSRDFISSSKTVSHLEGLPIFKEFLQKQDEAMSLFIEGLLSTVHQELASPPNGEHQALIDAGILAERSQDAPDVQPLRDSGIVESYSRDNNSLVIEEVKDYLDLRNPGLSLSSKTGLGKHRNFVAAEIHKIVFMFELWSEKWVNMKEPQRESRLARVVDSMPFQLLTVVIIVINTLCIAIQANYEMAQHKPLKALVLSEWFFVSFYILEICLKVRIHGLWVFANDDMYWNLFDLLVVTFSAFTLVIPDEMSNSMGFLRIFRILKAAKALRMFRVITFFHDLRIMMDCIAGSFLALFWCLVLLLLIMFIFAIYYVQDLGVQLVEREASGMDVSSIDNDDMHDRFGSIQRAVLTLYQLAFGMIEAEEIYNLLLPTGTMNAPVLLLFVGFYQIALINILTGIFVDKAMQHAKPDRDIEVMEHRQDTMERVDRLRELCQELQLSEPGIIKREEFMNALRDPDMRFAFQAEGLHISDAQAFFGMVQSVNNRDSVDTDTFVASCLRLRGVASSIDLQHLELQVKTLISELRTQIAVSVDGLRQLGETPEGIKVAQDKTKDAAREDKAGQGQKVFKCDELVFGQFSL